MSKVENLNESANATHPFSGVRTAKKIHSAMTRIKKQLQPVGKGGTNIKQSYKFRKVEDVYAACQLVMAENGVHMTAQILSEFSEERKSTNNATLIYRRGTYRWFFWCEEDGSYVTHDTFGEGMDSGDKASNKSMTASQKYALIQAFCIPTEEANQPVGEGLVDDADKDSHDVESKPKGYDPKNADDRKEVLAWLEKHKDKINPKLWNDIQNELAGKPLSDIAAVAKSVIARQQQLEEGQ